VSVRVTSIRKRSLRFFDFFYDSETKELYIALWFWLIIFYKDDVN